MKNDSCQSTKNGCPKFPRETHLLEANLGPLQLNSMCNGPWETWLSRANGPKLFPKKNKKWFPIVPQVNRVTRYSQVNMIVQGNLGPLQKSSPCNGPHGTHCSPKQMGPSSLGKHGLPRAKLFKFLRKDGSMGQMGPSSLGQTWFPEVPQKRSC